MAATTGFSRRSTAPMSRLSSWLVRPELGRVPLLLEAGEVAARGERLAPAGQDDPAHLLVGCGVVEDPQQLALQRLVQGVAPLRGGSARGAACPSLRVV